MAKFKMTVLTADARYETARLGSNTRTAGTQLVDNDKGKFVKLIGDSLYNLCAAGDPIEGAVTSIQAVPLDDYTIGDVQRDGRIKVTCDGTEAAGTGSISVGEYVVCGTVVAAGTALGALVYPKVRSATNQPGTAIVSTVATADTAAAVKVALDAVLVTVADVQKNAAHGWRVISLTSAGAVGDTAVIERV
jgi:hypothetical protein